ncbi:MAG: tyrosine-type recombinase/integrase [Candidatus Aminicenantes bacterium]|nr:tyrosine-type recombinase/integrase [Candidatus Aminicenantes bacterium]
MWLNFKRFAIRLGMEDVNIHTFRHTIASYLVMAGVDFLTVKKILGRKEISPKMKNTHHAPGYKKNVVDALNSFSQGVTRKYRCNDKLFKLNDL